MDAEERRARWREERRLRMADPEHGERRRAQHREANRRWWKKRTNEADPADLVHQRALWRESEERRRARMMADPKFAARRRAQLREADRRYKAKTPRNPQVPRGLC